MAWLWWLGAALVMGVIETLTVDLTFLMLAGGALGGAAAAALGGPLWVQALVFAVVSVLLLVLALAALGYCAVKLAPFVRRTVVDREGIHVGRATHPWPGSRRQQT